jgi:hypothetical protein
LHSAFTQTQNSGTDNVRNFIFKNTFAELLTFSHKTCFHSLWMIKLISAFFKHSWNPTCTHNVTLRRHGIAVSRPFSCQSFIHYRMLVLSIIMLFYYIYFKTDYILYTCVCV